MVPLSMTLSDFDPDFKVMTFLKSNIGKMARLKEKLSYYFTLIGTIPNVWNGTMFGDLD